MSQSGVISNPNSSTNPLIANGEFIGTAENVAQYAGLYYAIECSTNATLALEFSQDSGNWSQVQVLNVSANVLKEGLITIKNRYFRSRVVNITGDAQTFLRLSIIYKQVIPTEVNIDTTGLATEETAQSQLTELGLISGCVADNKLAVSGTVSVDTTGLASETTALQSLSNVSALRTYIETSFSFSPDKNLWVQVDTSEIPVDVEVGNQITGFSLESTQQEILHTVSHPPAATLILDSPEGISAYADSVPVPVVDIYKRPGWSYTNTSAGNKFNYYFYSNGNTTQTLSDITGAWCICENDSTTTTSSIVNPIISIYTVGSLNVWYQSSRAYAANTNMVAGMKYLCYWGVEPTVFPELPRIQLTLARSNGTLLPGETVLTMSVGSDSGAPAGVVKNLMTHIGWRNASNEFITELIGDADFISTDVRILDKLSTGIAVSGSVSVSNFPASQTVSVSNFPATQPISGSVSVSNLPATQPVSGSVSVSNFPATQAVSVATLPSIEINNFPATQPVSGSVSVSNLPATQAVSGSVSVSNLPATQPVSGSVSVSNFPATQAVSVATLPAVAVSNFADSGLAKEITLGSVYTTLGGMATTTTAIGNNTLKVADCVNNGIYNLGIKIRESSALVEVSNVGFSNLSNLNIPVSYINSNLALTNGNLSILSGAVADNKFQCNVSIASGQKVIIDGGSVLISGGSVGVSGLVEVSNIALSNIDIPISYINSNVSGLSSCVSESNLNVRCFGSSDGTTFHHIKTNPNGVVATNAILETASGSLSATVSSGNYNALDVSVKNSSLPINSVNSGSWGNAVNNGSLNGSQYTSGIDVSASSYIYVIYRDGSTGVFDSILVEWSFDNTNWYYLGDSIFPSTPQGQQYRQGTLNDKRKYGWNYLRFKNGGNSSLSSVYITILGSSI